MGFLSQSYFVPSADAHLLGLEGFVLSAADSIYGFAQMPGNMKLIEHDLFLCCR